MPDLSEVAMAVGAALGAAGAAFAAASKGGSMLRERKDRQNGGQSSQSGARALGIDQARLTALERAETARVDRESRESRSDGASEARIEALEERQDRLEAQLREDIRAVHSRLDEAILSVERARALLGRR